MCLASCDDYDDTELWNKVNGLEERIAALEEWQKTTDNNLNALQTLINTMDYITSVAPIMQANDTIGYTINFHQSTPISIYNGTTSQIGITQDEEGNWLWTLDGEILTTPDGTPIPANGQDAAAPQLSTGKALQDEGIKTDAAGDAIIADIAYLSVDEGETWYRVTGEKGEQGDKGNTGSTGATGPAGPAGANGDSFFEDVEIVGNNVIFTLADGTTFTIAKYNGALTFMQNGKALDLTTTIDLADGALTYAPSDAEVSARIIDGEGWSASAENGTITVSPGSMGEEATLEITLLENGRVIETYRLTIEQTGLQGAGTADNPYLVSSAAELIYMAEQVNNNSGTNYYYQKVIQLTQDIDLEGTELTIGIYKDEKKYFYGTLDGNGHSIKGLKIDNHDQQYVGLFPRLASYATVKNLTLENPSIKGTYSGSTSARVGVLAGCLSGGTIENCHVVNGTVESTEAVCGGIVGDLNSGNISNCSVEGTTITAVSNGGGIAGFVPSTRSNPLSITACYFNGTLTSDEFAGGIVGTLFNKTDYDVTIQACYASGSISGYMKKESDDEQGLDNSYISTGGIVGKIQFNCKVSACYSTASLSGKGTNGGIIGLFSTDQGSDPTVSDCYWSTSSASVPTYGIGAKGGNSAKDGGNDEGAAKVDNSTTTWSDAMSAMNTVLTGTGWRYETSSDTSFPLVIKATE